MQENAWRLKAAGLGAVVGLELESAARRLIVGGTDPEIADELLGAAEAGLVAAYSEKEDADE